MNYGARRGPSGRLDFVGGDPNGGQVGVEGIDPDPAGETERRREPLHSIDREEVEQFL